MSGNEGVSTIAGTLDPPSAAQRIVVRRRTSKKWSLMPFGITFILFAKGFAGFLSSYASENLILRNLSVATMVVCFIFAIVLCFIHKRRQSSSTSRTSACSKLQ
ncbi:hypothetical protein TNCT_585111 [Trichonephila clavata]|uniref:Uncharacterized protein n=1 Tax=Trichonephila clavata TaxID=2740835 RepID=A0A8X6GIQ3_TRICU|nr:hypothetical protein TNCT_585111 [Trichonephila clavata]